MRPTGDAPEQRIRVGLVSAATYSAVTGRCNKDPARILMPLTWPVLTAFLNDSPDRERYRYVHYDDVTQDDLSVLRDVPVVLFTAYTGHIYRAVELAQELRRLASRPQKFILGGIHVTAVVKEAVRAYLLRRLAQAGAAPRDGAGGQGSRITPLLRLLEEARPHLDPGELDLLQADPAAFLADRVESARIEDVVESRLLPGPHYVEELARLRAQFDVLFAGLLDGDPVFGAPVREELRAEIEAPEIRARTLLTLGFGDVNRPERPNWAVCLEDGNAAQFPPSPVSSRESGRAVPGLPYEAGRGCPYACDFCSVVNFFGPLRYRDVDLVHDDLLHAIENLSALEFFLVDDNINADIKRFRRLVTVLQRIKDKHPMFGWAGQFSFHNIVRHEDDIRAARAAGLRSCYLGLESVAEETLAAVNKGHNQREEVRAGLQILKRHDVAAYCNVITGLPADGEDFPEKMIAGLRDLDVPAILPFNLSPLPGTVSFNRLHQEGNRDLAAILAGGWKYNNSFDVVLGTDSLSREELVRVRDRFSEAYSSYDRILESITSYYRSPPLIPDAARWFAAMGPFVQILLFNLLIVRAMREHRHFLPADPTRST